MKTEAKKNVIFKLTRMKRNADNREVKPQQEEGRILYISVLHKSQIRGTRRQLLSLSFPASYQVPQILSNVPAYLSFFAAARRNFYTLLVAVGYTQRKQTYIQSLYLLSTVTYYIKVQNNINHITSSCKQCLTVYPSLLVILSASTHYEKSITKRLLYHS